MHPTIEREFSVRPCRDESDFYAYWNISCRSDPTHARTFTKFLDSLRSFPKDAPHERMLFVQESKPVALGVAIRNIWQPDPDLYWMEIAKPDLFSVRQARRAIEIVAEKAKSLGAKKLVTWHRDRDPSVLQAYRDLGFEHTMINSETGLELQSFDPAPFEGAVAKVKAAGYDITTQRELLDRDPEGAWHTWYELEVILMKDVPSSWGEPGAEPFEQWQKSIQRRFDAESTTFFARKDGELVGVSMLERNEVNPQYFITALTGVRREHRRHGIATALKVLALSRAKELGGMLAVTDNEKNNPMLELNTALGFKQISALHSFVRDA